MTPLNCRSETKFDFILGRSARCSNAERGPWQIVRAFQESKQEKPRARQVETRESSGLHQMADMSVGRCASKRCVEPGQESPCPNTSQSLLLLSQVHRGIYLASKAILGWLAPSRAWAKLALSALVTWDRRWPRTLQPADGG